MSSGMTEKPWVARIRESGLAVSFTETDQIVSLFERLQRYVGWTDQDAEHLRRAWPVVQPSVPMLLNDFYETILAEPATARLITGGQAQIERLKLTLAAWLEQLFRGPYDKSYVLRRWQIGWRHVEIGLEQSYAAAALSRLRLGLTRVLLEKIPLDSASDARDDLPRIITALHRALDLDLSLINMAYHVEFTRRLQQYERLATLGQIAGGIAHELRNPLNVIQTSAYYVLSVRNLSDEKIQKEKIQEHLERVQRQVFYAAQVIDALSDLARLPAPHRQAVLLRQCIDGVIQEMSLPRDIVIQLDIPTTLPPVRADPRQLGIVFRNVLANARDAIPQSGTIRVSAVTEGQQVCVSVTDNGCGISPDVLAQVTKPFFTTKPHGLGMGLAMVEAILDSHGGRLCIESQVGIGTTVRIFLPVFSQPD